MKPVLVCLLLSHLMLGGLACANDPIQSKARVVSAIPVLHLLNEELLKNTGIEAAYLPPKRLPISRIGNWIKRKGEQAVKSGALYAAVATIESVRPDLSFYALIRSTNIKVIPVDAANELSPTGSKITLPTAAQANEAFFWLDINNLITMSQILARDYATIWPELANQIVENQERVQASLNLFTLKRDELLLETERFNLCVADEKLLPLATSLNMPITAATESCEADASIRLLKASKKEGSAAGRWAVNALDKPINSDLHTWLDRNLASLEAAVAR